MWWISPHGVGDTRHILRWNKPSGCHQHWDLVNVPLVQVDNELITSRGTFRLAQHRSSRSPAGVSTNRQIIGRAAERPAEVTDIIPFNEFGDLADLDFRENSAFDREAQVIRAPELDDLHDTDDQLPQRLAVPVGIPPGSARRTPFISRVPRQPHRRQRRQRRDRHLRHRRPQGRAPQARGARQGPLDGRRDGGRRDRRGRVLDGQRLDEGARDRAGRGPDRSSAAARSPVRRRHAGRRPSPRRSTRPCTPRRSPRPLRSPRSAQNARPGCSGRCS